ncbi:short-chain dehydrogenase [Sphingobium indicum IP26]|uniref:Short-chain dehydrogenase n=1 Tax=Sphingobium indicum F2 TaxID=1450518 RepID=A0A8E0WPN2_9SPHN|nr:MULTISPECIES: SDR family NAD(P)-dependent oxidoreductase [Sphingobium]EPR15228.1 short-chain dehydrogenase [Sphingobium indicum IP26]EQB03036.1 short-chain dehydrogenase [Sphingobium sp. HDIP04]KER34969.1 short-chain dehydrogenase [Sphingobium indicum F2]KER35499.1 short-chain dehydrogenase [Sphingobium indicum F2]
MTLEPAMSLEGRVALMTAAGSGIGRASALAVASLGASVMVTDINADSARDVADRIVSAGGRARHMALDVAQEEQIAAAVAAATSAFGRLDILHNNAAYQGADAIEGDIDVVSMTVDFWNRMMAVNLTSHMLGCKHAIPAMLENGGGSIINTASMYGLAAYQAMPCYGISKAGVAMLTKYVAASHGKRGIRCNAIAPAVILTEGVKRFLPQELVDMNESHAALPYLGKPEDVAAMVAFLASDAARFISGQVIAIDGGTTAQLPTVTAARALAEKARTHGR